MTSTRQCDLCTAPPFRWLLDLLRHQVDDHGLPSHRLPAPRPQR